MVSHGPSAQGTQIRGFQRSLHKIVHMKLVCKLLRNLTSGMEGLSLSLDAVQSSLCMVQRVRGCLSFMNIAKKISHIHRCLQRMTRK